MNDCEPFKEDKTVTRYVNNVRREMSQCSERHDKCPKCRAAVCGRHWWVGKVRADGPELQWHYDHLPKYRRLEIAAEGVLKDNGYFVFPSVQDALTWIQKWYPETTQQEIEDMMEVLTKPKDKTA